jgi:TFIIF-interacting CTD phosphatase-like protein
MSSVNNLETSSRTSFPSKRREDKGKLTVVIDLDDILLFNINERRRHRERILSDDDYESFVIQVDGRPFVLNKRNWLDEFLEIASQEFELIALTSGGEEYGRAVIENIDPEGRYFRHCLFLGNGRYVNDLKCLNRRMERIVLVQHLKTSFHRSQIYNVIQMDGFSDKPFDDKLYELLLFLQKISEVKDIRKEIYKIIE